MIVVMIVLAIILVVGILWFLFSPEKNQPNGNSTQENRNATQKNSRTKKRNFDGNVTQVNRK